MTVGAFAYLIMVSYRNAMRSRFKRIREPRYLLGLALGVTYIWFFLFKYTASPENPGAFFLANGVRVLATAGLFMMIMSAWLFGADRAALAFTPAEVAFLFPAPLSRRALVGYRLFRAQFAILFNTLIWVLIVRQSSGSLSPLLRALSMWMLFTTLNFHRLAAALVRTSVTEHGGHGARRHRGSIAIFAVVLAVIAAGIWSHRVDFQAAPGARGFVDALRLVIDSPPANVVLWPVHAILEPVFAPDAASWLDAIPVALLLLVLHAWWVLRTDAAFEEAALTASAERAALIKELRDSRGWRRRRPKVTAVRAPLRLSSSGNPAMAIVWKNLICLRRTMSLTELFPILFPGIITGVAAALEARAQSDGTVGVIMPAIATAAATTIALLLLFGARIIRNDLRHDMLHLVALKTLPLRGHAIVAAEVLSAAIPIAILQLLLLALAVTALGAATEGRLTGTQALLVWIGAVPAFVAFNIASVTVQNAAPVLFPSWTRLGTTTSPGLESLGQNLVSFGLVLVMLLLMLVLPALLGGGVWVGGSALGISEIGAGIGLLLGCALLAVESYVAVRAFGRALERTEPSQVA